MPTLTRQPRTLRFWALLTSTRFPIRWSRAIDETVLRLTKSVSATIDSSGEAIVSLGPSGPRETWRVRKMTVSLSTGAGRFRVYRGPVGNFKIDGTDTASF